MQVEAHLRIHDREAAVDVDHVKACRTRRPRKAIDGGMRHTPGPFQHLVGQIPVGTQSVEVGM